MSAIDAVSRLLESIGARYALIGGRAVAARGYPRMTLDYDFLTSDRRVLESGTWKPLEQAGAVVDPRKGVSSRVPRRASGALLTRPRVRGVRTQAPERPGSELRERGAQLLSSASNRTPKPRP